MPHSIGGAYATYWCSQYPEEIEAIVFVDGSQLSEERLMPYIEKMGNCELICLGGDHMIYEQKPIECGEMIKNFIDGLDN